MCALFFFSFWLYTRLINCKQLKILENKKRQEFDKIVYLPWHEHQIPVYQEREPQMKRRSLSRLARVIRCWLGDTIYAFLTILRYRCLIILINLNPDEIRVVYWNYSVKTQSKTEQISKRRHRQLLCYSKMKIAWLKFVGEIRLGTLITVDMNSMSSVK